MRVLYLALLRLYPGSYREVFGAEMLGVFEQFSEERRQRGFGAYVLFLLAEFGDAVTGACAMWTDEYAEQSKWRLRAPFLASLLGGVVLAALSQGVFYKHIGERFTPRDRDPAGSVASTISGDTVREVVGSAMPLILPGATLLFVSIFSLAFLWNLRTVGSKARNLQRRGRRHPTGREFRQIYDLEDNGGAASGRG